MRQKSCKKNNTMRVLLIMGVILSVLVAFLLFWGLTAKNIHFYLPRRGLKVGAILLVSFCIGYSAVTFQTITNNRILTPSVMGLDSLYMFIQTFVVYMFGSRQLAMMTGYTDFFISVGAMVLCSWGLFLLLFKGEGKNVYFLVLAGMIIGNLFGGMSTFMQVLLDPNEFDVLQGKMFASFNTINTDLFGICIVLIVLIILISYKDLKYLDVISLGEEHAINLGVPYKKIVLKTLMIISVLIAISTVLVGPITFLGILVVSLSREMVKSFRHTHLVAGAVLLGGIALSFGTIIVEKLFHNETTISVIINFVGGIYFIYLMVKESKR